MLTVLALCFWFFWFTASKLDTIHFSFPNNKNCCAYLPPVTIPCLAIQCFSPMPSVSVVVYSLALFVHLPRFTGVDLSFTHPAGATSNLGLQCVGTLWHRWVRRRKRWGIRDDWESWTTQHKINIKQVRHDENLLNLLSQLLWEKGFST